MSNQLILENPLSSDNKPVATKEYVDTKEFVNSFVYQVINCGYYASATSNFIPINGYIIEKTSTTSSNEFVSFVAPYNGTVEKVMWRSEAYLQYMNHQMEQKHQVLSHLHH